MKIICNTTDFAEAVGACARLAGGSKIIPILENVKLEAEGDELTVTGSSGEMTLVRRMLAQVDDEGAVLLPAKTLADLARKLPAGELIIESAGAGICIRCGQMKSVITSANVELFPKLARAKDGEAIELPADLLRRAIARVKHAVGQDNTRPILSGIHIRADEDKLTVTALDGIQLATTDLTLNASAKFEAVLPAGAAAELEKFGDGPVTLRTGKARIEAESGDMALYAQRTEGEYIKFDQFFGRPRAVQTTVHRADLLSAIERAVAVADRKIAIDIAGDRMHLSAMSQTSDYAEDLDIYHAGPDISAKYDARLLCSALKAMDAENTDIAIDDGNVPIAMVTPSGDLSHRMLVFPRR
jgi:DNA polymerase-3 subunit beta